MPKKPREPKEVEEDVYDSAQHLTQPEVPMPAPDGGYIPEPEELRPPVPVEAVEVVTPPMVEWCKDCQAPRLVDTKHAHWCGQCRRVPLKVVPL